MIKEIIPGEMYRWCGSKIFGQRFNPDKYIDDVKLDAIKPGDIIFCLSFTSASYDSSRWLLVYMKNITINQVCLADPDKLDHRERYLHVYSIKNLTRIS